MEQITLTKEELGLLNSIQERHINKFNVLVNDVFNEVVSNSNTFKEAKEKLKELRIHSGTNGDIEPLIDIYKKAEEKLEEKINATPIKK
ncbi:transcriptional regulator [Staphylococcus pseudintermedius]|uniref:transcriptional regulator n=1 Tax=Staphylococcus pseudintermedius TaxID=283734 RepID=UPI0019E19E5F|nr:transcriptional regulator [Staphylococcus pseudintermedius]EGQ1629936.1 transcriptional regulator [Staphylococcus pseudintermedius]EGQ1706656.1 transcriptional regulator [Staphylococcus pseudintermedius]EGQ2757024.1 transcriptional regulator [Staphylococcus pseudintermedius]EGQ2940360.1 transcriptional regulator [Staphylococcus pseudintermedius]EGQ2979502.1 transcriptional regulator [Staphylococcus pseudintermedius]